MVTAAELRKEYEDARVEVQQKADVVRMISRENDDPKDDDLVLRDLVVPKQD